ncbi:HAMP domain-containing sensor histidine kinase [Pseudonocardia xishanensis]|uniref:histidine kinase n=1 Tax=Pseudonocardia xishanensis TaxID=630995 RepID=A0ABP8RH15_9PSEU
MARPPGPSVRLKLALSYAGVVVVAGIVLLAALWVSLRYFFRPDGLIITTTHPFSDGVVLSFVPVAAVVLGFLTVVGLVGGWVLAGRMLAPLTRLTDATRLAATGSLTHRIRLPGRRDEFRELADAFDTMLARLDAHVAAQRRFAANASHELRTPLAITQALLDVARLDPDHPAPLARLREVNTRAIDLTEALLLLSRADQRAFTGEDVDLSLLAEEATEALVPLADRHGVALETVTDPAPTVGSPALLLQLTTNLVLNAIVHNLPEHGTVRIRTGAGPGAAELVVENTGALLDPRSVATLAEPFRRGTGRVRTDHAGVGLGLAIVASITEAHDGTLTLTPLPSGGLRVSVLLRLSADARPDAPE